MTEIREVIKVKMRITESKSRIFFAHVLSRKPQSVSYMMVNKEGDQFLGPREDHKEIFIGSPEDIVWEKPARMNLKYGELEIIK